MNISIKNINDYLALQSEPVMEALENLRQLIKDTSPEAEEVISYSMPAFKYNGRILIYFAAFKNHCSLFLGTTSLNEKLKKELKPYITSKGTIRFTVDKPLPKALVKKIIKARMKENELKAKTKKQRA